jgi:hypothetical protein
MQAAVAHRAWAAAVESFLMGVRHVPPVLDPHRCRFGRWLDSERQNPMAVAPAFQRADQLHRKLHERAEQAAAHQTRGSGPEVELEVRELHRVRDVLLEQLDLLLLDAVS